MGAATCDKKCKMLDCPFTTSNRSGSRGAPRETKYRGFLQGDVLLAAGDGSKSDVAM